MITVPTPHASILIAEDDTILQELYGEACTALAIDCVQTYEGLETWDLLEKDAGQFDAIILDIMLPGLSGEAILSKLRKKHPDHPPVIVVSAIAESKGSLTDLEPGEVIYIVKGDVSLKTILTAILAYLGKNEETEGPSKAD